MTNMLTIGKYRALQRASTADGIFNILAIDHMDSLKRAINPENPMSVTDEQMTVMKRDVVSTLMPYISGTLLDPVYGAAQMISQDLPKQVGLLVELEKADYSMQPLPLVVDIRPNWSVEKIKRMSADGVKLFYYYDPDNNDLCQQQDTTIQAVVNDCAVYDIPLYAEPIVSNVNPDNRQRKVIESAKRANDLGADILKVEFPIDASANMNHADWQEACEALNDAVHRPWVLLSAGVDFEVFCQQVAIACQAGASGFIVGRAVWGDACTIQNSDERIAWLKTNGIERIQKLNNIAKQYATSWHKIYHPPQITPDWHIHY